MSDDVRGGQNANGSLGAGPRRLRTVQDLRARRKRLIVGALLVGSAMLMVNALVGPNGYLARINATHEYEALQQQLLQVRAENDRLREETDRLRHDPSAIEEEARRSLNLIKPGEVLVIVHDGSSAAKR